MWMPRAKARDTSRPEGGYVGMTVCVRVPGVAKSPRTWAKTDPWGFTLLDPCKEEQIRT